MQDHLRVRSIDHPVPPYAGKPTKVTRSHNGLGVFGANRTRPFHRWYPFVEGYSAELVERALAEPAPDGVVFDPFGGSGTTCLSAAMLGRSSAFAEVNPYLAWIAEVKINRTREVAALYNGPTQLRRLAAGAASGVLPTIGRHHPLLAANHKRSYFPSGTAESALSLLALIDEVLAGPLREVARLAVATSLVPASYMVRRTDLRRRVTGDPAPVELRSTVARRLSEFSDDIERHGTEITAAAQHIAQDIRQEWLTQPRVSLIVTSPPYLNGTNYCRNTKLELLAMGFVSAETDLQALRLSSISAGINNVSKRRKAAPEIDCVEPVAKQLDAVAYDPRIPTLVRTYFADMQAALARMRVHALPGARMFLDIGDSRYCGIQVPTHKMLTTIAESQRWKCLEEEVIRTRRSYDGTQLTQVLLHFAAA